ncbi:hypothetical protein AVEN_58555-1 [Araneus ventricosus]|uniref:Uncharacterized protein n=1 Tax=Araneus ventricosus TaxID=182803 RepID=A0A4Y2Q388_ARAVE|nr:hypothetical protein AVEN_58555-1 [Araneus ventricosus]
MMRTIPELAFRFPRHTRRRTYPTYDLTCNRPTYTADLKWDRVSNVEPSLSEAETLPIDNRCNLLAQSSARPNPKVRSPTENERFMVKEESAASVGTRPWTPEGRSLTLYIVFML